MPRRGLPHLDPSIRLIEGDDGAEGGAPPEGEAKSGDSGNGGGSGDGGSGDQGDSKLGEEGGTGGSGDAADAEKNKGAVDGPPGKSYDEKYVAGLRDEAIKARKKGDEDRDALLKGFRKLLGEDADAEETDPSKLLASTVKERDDARAGTAGMVRENAVLRATGALGVDAERLLDSRGFERALAELDPAADTFGVKVKDLIKKAAERDPTLKSKATPTPPSGGERMGGEAGSGAQSTGGIDARRAAYRDSRGAK